MGTYKRSLSLKDIEELKRIKSQKSKVEKKAVSLSDGPYALKKEYKTSNTKSENKSDKRGIVVNRMYVGGYLADNLGHEIINLFQADNGRHYLYLNSSGSFARGHENIDTMLMARYVGKDCFEVVALAKGLKFAPGSNMTRSRDIMEFNQAICDEQLRYIESQPTGGIRYGGISILDIFNDAEQQSVFITYEAEKVLLPKGDMRILLNYNKEAFNCFGEKETVIAIRHHNLPKTSLKSYIYSEDNSSSYDYQNILDNLINNDSLWCDDREWKVKPQDAGVSREISLFDICRINDDENRFSNALAYFMTQPEYRGLWQDYFNTLGVSLEDDYKVEREVSSKINDSEGEKEFGIGGGRIDLLISDKNNLVVIENKIKSDINTVEEDARSNTTQLNRYQSYISWKVANDRKEKRLDRKATYLILCPDYNQPELRESERDYRIITYGNLYDYLKDREAVNNDHNFRALKNAMLRHTMPTANGYLYNEMLEKFERRIKELKLT